MLAENLHLEGVNAGGSSIKLTDTMQWEWNLAKGWEDRLSIDYEQAKPRRF